ncbi:helix-turn-helix domain-containing protein [Sphingomonas sp. CJ99]
MSLAVKLKDLRTRARQSLQQVADGVGVSKAHIWELETGKSRNPGIELVRKLAEHFSVTIAFLTSDEGEQGEDPAALQFFRDFDGLSDRDWDALRSIAERLKGK